MFVLSRGKREAIKPTWALQSKDGKVWRFLALLNAIALKGRNTLFRPFRAYQESRLFSCGVATGY
jgi:hypothetical protein